MKYINNYIQKLNEGKKTKIKNFLLDSKLDGKIEKIRVSDLTPTQNEIFLDEIVSNLLKKRKFVKKSLKGKFKDKEILVSSDNYIIDGHHKWASAFILNSNCKIKCTKINMPIKEAIETLTELLKEINADSQRQSGKFKYNIYELIKKDDDKLKNSILEIFKDKNGSKKKLLKKIKKSEHTDSHPLNYILDNIYKLPTPDHKKYDRKEMPQLSDKEIDEILN